MKKQILALTVLLLSLPVQLLAQNRSHDDLLKGLRISGVAVKYGVVDGLPEEMRPSMLQALHDRARNRLMQADIPLLDPTADLTGKPLVVFTVTVNKEVEHAPAIRVDAAVTERVRLRRDQSKEIELVTWMQSGFGYPTVTNKMLLDVFDGQVNFFIKEYKANNPKTTETESQPPGVAPEVKDNANSLEGLPGIRAFASVRKGHDSDEQQREALQKFLQTAVEKKLKEAGIPLLKYANELEPAGEPLLYVWVKLSGPNSHAPAIEIDSRFWQQVRPLRDVRKDLQVVTWETTASGAGPITDDAVLHLVTQQLDDFIKAYTSANPRLSANPSKP